MIRIAIRNDIDRLVLIDKIANVEIKSWSPMSNKEFKEILDDKKQILIIAENEDQIIGYLDAEIKEDMIFINDIFVLKQHRKQGYAKDMIRFISDKYKKAIHLITKDNNIKTFERLGFVKTMNYMEYKSKTIN